MHLRDHGLGQAGDHLHHRAAAGEQIMQRIRTLIGASALVAHLVQVMARAKRLARTAQHDHPLVWCIHHLVEARANCGQHRIGQGIQPRGQVQRQICDRPVIGTQHQRVGHGLPLSFAAIPARLSSIIAIKPACERIACDHWAKTGGSTIG